MSFHQEAANLFGGGIIAPWYLKPFQLGPYDTIRSNRFPFIEQSRRTGKTNEVLAFVMEQLIRNPGWICRWCEPWKYQAREIIMPEIELMQRFARRADRFVFKSTDSYYIHPNGSRLYLRGINEDKGESARGPKAHIIVADEYGSWKNAKYVVNHIFMPQLLSTRGPLIRLSTPPSDLGHKYYEDKERAIRDNRYCKRTIWDSLGELYDRMQIQDIMDEVGGEDSEAWKREFLCLEIGDIEKLVLPEFTEMMGKIVVAEVKRPTHFDTYIGADSGFDDNTFALFGYYDFIRDVVVIEREYCDNRKTTNQHIAEWRKIEAELWGGPDGEQPKVYKRTMDADKQKLYDIMVEEHYTVNRPHKAHKMASVNTLRERIRRGGIEIHESCVNLLRQMRVGMWRDDQKKDFDRTDGLGHLDGIAALMYFNRSVNIHRNPFPPDHGLRASTHYIPVEKRTEARTEHQKLANVFRRK